MQLDPLQLHHNMHVGKHACCTHVTHVLCMLRRIMRAACVCDMRRTCMLLKHSPNMRETGE